MHSRRVYTALVFLPFFFVLVQYLHPIAFLAFVLVGILLTQYEYSRFHAHRGWYIPSAVVGSLLSVGIGISFYYGYQVSIPIGLSSMGAIVGIGYWVTHRGSRAGGLTDPIIILFGTVYIGWMLSHLVLLRGLEGGIALIFFVFLVTWASDTAAYYVGSSFGRHKLAPQISPGKTFEGAIGGLAGSVVMAVIAKFGFVPWLDLVDSLVIGLLFGSIGQAGDLFESSLKRHAGVKDSGTLLPGHGGLLDRVDSLIFTSPAFYYYVMLTKPRALFFS